MQTVSLLIQGKVQGVFYRASAKNKASELGLKGWVKNTEDGNVEIVASGEQKILEQFIDWCYKGPSQAVVSNIIVSKIDEAYPKEFHIIK